MPLSRVISAVVAIALALGLIITGGWYFTIGFGVIVFLGQLEIFRLVQAKGIVPAVKTTLVVSQLMLIVAHGYPALADAILPLGGTFICFYLLFQPKFATIADVAASILGLFYGGYLPSYWIRLRDLGSQCSTLGRLLACRLAVGRLASGAKDYPVGLCLHLGCRYRRLCGGAMAGSHAPLQHQPQENGGRRYLWTPGQYYRGPIGGLWAGLAELAVNRGCLGGADWRLQFVGGSD